MADAKNGKPGPGGPSAKDAPPPAPPTPEEEATQRINSLQALIKSAEGEIRTAEGRLSNRDPVVMIRLQAENKELRARVEKLRKALFAVLSEAMKPRNPADVDTEFEQLRQAATEYFKRANINEDLWKRIVS